MSDKISNTFVQDINMKIFRKNLLVVKFILIISFLFGVTELIVWYRVFTNTSFAFFVPITAYILPITIFTILILSFISWYYQLKGNKLIIRSIEKEEFDLFNNGFKKLTIANILSATCFTLALIGALVTVFIQEKII